MTTSPVTTTTKTHLFLGIPIPSNVVTQLTRGMQQYPQYIERAVPPERWHLTVVFLGEVENPRQYYSRLFKTLPQVFVPTVALMHLGRGLTRSQLWAFAHPSTGLLSLRQQLLERLKKMRVPLPQRGEREFTPHIHVADLFAMSRGIGIADHPLSVSFAIPAVHIYRSTLDANGPTYTIEGTIEL